MRWTRRAWVMLCAASAVSTGVRPAGASPSFPRDIERDLSLSYAPPCSLCHDRGKPGPGTVVTPFGLSMRAAGLIGGDAQSLAQALDTLKADGTDSDGDGVPDVTELIDGTDPNSSASAPEDVSGPGYGCGGSAPKGGGPGLAGSPVLAFLALILRRGARRPE